MSDQHCRLKVTTNRTFHFHLQVEDIENLVAELKTVGNISEQMNVIRAAVNSLDDQTTDQFSSIINAYLDKYNLDRDLNVTNDLLKTKNWIMVWNGSRFVEVSNFSEPVTEKIYIKNLFVVVMALRNVIISFKE